MASRLEKIFESVWNLSKTFVEVKLRQFCKALHQGNPGKIEYFH
jgi:hypothetical protein